MSVVRAAKTSLLEPGTSVATSLSASGTGRRKAGPCGRRQLGTDGDLLDGPALVRLFLSRLGFVLRAIVGSPNSASPARLASLGRALAPVRHALDRAAP